MAKLKQRDVIEILNIFERELNSLQKLDKIEKMKLRKKIVNVLKPALELGNPDIKIILNIVENNLNDVLDLFLDRYNFMRNLQDELAKKPLRK